MNNRRQRIDLRVNYNNITLKHNINGDINH